MPGPLHDAVDELLRPVEVGVVAAPLQYLDCTPGIPACNAPRCVSTGVTQSREPNSPSAGTFTGGESSTCSAIDVAGNIGAATFTVTVTAAGGSSPAGRMFGFGTVAGGGLRHHFLFRVRQANDREYGRLEYWASKSGRDEFGGASKLGEHDGDYKRRRPESSAHFDATTVTAVVFSDAAGYQPGRPGRAGVDTVHFSGAGRWNGKPGYTFEAVAFDRGEPGHKGDTFSLGITGPKGGAVANISGRLVAGNVQAIPTSR